MKRDNISPHVIRRLPRYLDRLDQLHEAGVERISSAELGRRMHLTGSQIRQDFACFGEFGQQGYGYNVAGLRDEIMSILGMDRQHTAVLVGLGNLGHALLQNFDFARCGFRMLAAFDVLPSLCGSVVGGVPVYHAATLSDFIRRNGVDMAVLTVPQHEACTTAAQLAEAGIGAIWNFTSCDLQLTDPSVLVEHIRFSDSLLSLSYHMKARADASVEQELEAIH